MHVYRYQVGGQTFDIVTDGTNNVTLSVAFEEGDKPRPLIMTKDSALKLSDAIRAIAVNAAEPKEW